MTSLNAFPVTSAGRRPRAIVKVGGTAISGWIDWEVTNNSFAEADTFRVSFAASALPKANNAAWFSQQTEVFVEILAGFPSNPDAPNASELTSHIYGRADEIDLDPVSQIVSLSGRDLTAAFIDTKLTRQYTGKTASQIVSAIAGKHGITANVQATTGVVGSAGVGQVGTYFLRSQVRMQTSNSEWDLITWLARESGLVAYVQGQTLNFVADPRSSATPYLIQWTPAPSGGGSPQSNAAALTFTRSQTVAKGISVTVQSSGFLGPTITRSYPRNPKGVAAGQSSPFGPATNYFFVIASNQNAQQVEAAAEAKYREIVSHAMKLQASMPGDGLLAVTAPLVVQGTGTAFDQTYFPRLITRRMSVDEGYRMEVQAQNTTPELEQATS